MRKSKRITAVILTVAVLLAVTGVALFVFVPAQMEGRLEEDLSFRARSTADYLAANARVGLAGSRSTTLRDAAELARLEPDLAYAVVVNERGKVVATAFPNVDLNVDWESQVSGVSSPEIVDARATVVVNDWLAGTIYVGLSRDAQQASLKQDRMLVAGFAGFMVLLALASAAGAVQMKRLRNTAEEWQQRHMSVRRQAGDLYSSVREHRQTQRSLQASESKYKSLFENTMASAMADLEELNRHLEKRKADLEHEVGVRKKAEVSLRRYTERLQLLNAVERSLLEGKSVEESAELALSMGMKLLPAARMTLVESDTRTGEAWIVGQTATYKVHRKIGDTIPFAEVQTHAKVRSCADLAAEDEASAVEKAMLREGLLSYVDVPLVVRDEVVGVLTVASSLAEAFSEEHFNIARDIADLMAIGVHRSRLDTERELYEQELVLARDRAEDMARLKTAFLTNMSHEIRTPISGIMGFSQVLHDEVPDGLREFTGLIRESAHRLLNTINSVLELARIESGRDGLEVTRMDLGELVKEATERLEPLAKRKSLSFTFENKAPGALCDLDRACVDRIVTNLVDNAIKFTDGGAVRAQVTTRGQVATLEVNDTGVGIDPGFLPHLFDDFRQEQMEANREHEGSGLGLTVSKKLVDRLGGTIRITSEKGVGTSVFVDFPLAGATVEDAEAARQAVDRGAVPRQQEARSGAGQRTSA
ncbi:MAG: GAF domain-containing protein [Rhodothermales bacterium]|nr:GAF domain-containing protein [Rhodothermales bacterium]